MDGTRPQHPLSDSQLDRELESALGIEPTPEFLARVRTRIAAEPEGWSWRLALWGRGLQPVVVMAVAAVVLAIVVPTVMKNVKGPVPHATVAREVVVPGSERVESLPPADPTRPLRAVTAAAKAPASRPVEMNVVHTLPLQLSPVMFSKEDRIAFISFVTAVGDGRVPEKVVQALGEEGMASLAIAPLVINPLPSLARIERQGEGQW